MHEVCHCSAYPFPHRRGSGKCQQSPTMTTHQDLVEKAVGQRCTAIEFTGLGSVTLEFENGLLLSYNDGFCYADLDGVSTHGGSYEHRRVTVISRARGAVGERQMSYASCRLCKEMGTEPYKLPTCDRDDCPNGNGHALHKLFAQQAEPPSHHSGAVEAPIVTRNGVPVPDQAAGIEEFKRQALSKVTVSMIKAGADAFHKWEAGVKDGLIKPYEGFPCAGALKEIYLAMDALRHPSSTGADSLVTRNPAPDASAPLSPTPYKEFTASPHSASAQGWVVSEEMKERMTQAILDQQFEPDDSRQQSARAFYREQFVDILLDVLTSPPTAQEPK